MNHSGTLSISPSPPLLLTLSFAFLLNFLFESQKYVSLACPVPIFFHFCHTIIDLGHFHLFHFSLHVFSYVFTIPFSSVHHLTDIYTHAPLAKSPRHTTSPHCYETATSLRITFPTSCGMHVFPFSETKEWHLSLSQKRPLAIPPPLCKI